MAKRKKASKPPWLQAPRVYPNKDGLPKIIPEGEKWLSVTSGMLKNLPLGWPPKVMYEELVTKKRGWWELFRKLVSDALDGAPLQRLPVEEDDWERVWQEWDKEVHKDLLGSKSAYTRVAKQKAEEGTHVHNLCHYHGIGAEVDLTGMSDVVIACYNGYLEEWEKRGYDIYKSEEPVGVREIMVAGTPDRLVSCPERGYGIMDFKTSKYQLDTAGLDRYKAMTAKSIRSGYAQQLVVYAKGIKDTWGIDVNFLECWRIPQDGVGKVEVYEVPQKEWEDHYTAYRAGLYVVRYRQDYGG